MKSWLKKALPWIKALVWVLVILGLGYQFWKILHTEALETHGEGASAGMVLWNQIRAISYFHLGLSCILYLAGIGFSALYWHLLLDRSGSNLLILHSLRCYYLSQLGKYIPGKGLALFLRVTTAMEGAVPASTGAITAVYEVMVTMAAGATLALLLGILMGAKPEYLMGATFLLAVSLGPVLPFVFPRVVKKIAGRFLDDNFSPGRTANWRSLGNGLLLTGIGWFFLGASLLVLWAGMNQGNDLGNINHWLDCTAMVTLANVGGFVASTPGGLGAREYLLKMFLEPQLGAKVVTLVLLLRLLWTFSEVSAAALLYWFRPRQTDKN